MMILGIIITLFFSWLAFKIMRGIFRSYRRNNSGIFPDTDSATKFIYKCLLGDFTLDDVEGLANPLCPNHGIPLAREKA